MATIYGSTMNSTWRSYLTYTVTETPTTYKLDITDFGMGITGTTYYVTYNDRDAVCTLKNGTKTGSVSVYFGDITKTESWKNEWVAESVLSNTIIKTDSIQSITVSFAINLPKWARMKGNTMVEYGSTTSTASVTLTIPALSKPSVSLSALRSSEVDTSAEFTATISSFSSDEISSVVLTVGDTAYNLGSGTIGSSGVLTYKKMITGLSINRVRATLTATGSGGESDTYVYYLTSAFYTMDIGGKGKEIAFGQSASSDPATIPANGQFSCAMRPVFFTMAGEIKLWAGDEIPDGWLLCDGSEVSKTEYPYLYGVIGDLWGVPNSSTNFKLPNLMGRVPIGYDSSDTDFDTVGKTGGEKAHKLTTTEMPSHKHTSYYTAGTNRAASGSSRDTSAAPNTTVAHTVHSCATSSIGGGGAHNNLQPFAVIKFIICAI